MRYYVTGANGFIGKNLVAKLWAMGHDVRPIGRLCVGQIVTERNDFEVVHLAAYGNHYGQDLFYRMVRVNISWLELLLTQAAKNKSCLKFYNVSTSAIQLPVQTIYSLSKHFGEKMVESYNDPRFVNIRPYSVYGPGEADHRFIPTVIRALHSGETIQLDEFATHDWIHVDDFIDAMFNGYTNIGTGKCFQNLDIVMMLEDISKKKLNYEKAKLRSYDTKDWVCLKGVPHRPIYEGLKQTYEHFTQKNTGDK